MEMKLFKTHSACRECGRQNKLITHAMCYYCTYSGTEDTKISSFIKRKDKGLIGVKK